MDLVVPHMPGGPGRRALPLGGPRGLYWGKNGRAPGPSTAGQPPPPGQASPGSPSFTFPGEIFRGPPQLVRGVLTPTLTYFNEGRDRGAATFARLGRADVFTTEVGRRFKPLNC